MNVLEKVICCLTILLVLNLVTTLNFPRHLPFLSNYNSITNYYALIQKEVTKNSFVFYLHYPHLSQYSNLKRVVNLAEYIKFEIFLIEKDTIQFVFKDANTTAFEMPREEPFPFHEYKENMQINLNMENLSYDYEIKIKDRPFSFSLMRKSTKEIIFTTINHLIVFKNNYVEISTDLPSNNLFGLGERTTNFKLKSGIYTLFNHDLYGYLEDGSGKGKNRYGSHPMYLMRESSGNYHVSYLRNTFPMDINLDHDRSVLTYKIDGGVLDFTFFLGDTNPETATKMYHKFLGGYQLPPFWAMGFHQCRWGYKNLDMLKEVLKNYKVNNLPLDTIWSDIDYMKNHMPFTVDEDRFSPADLKKMLKDYNKKYVMISEVSMGTKWPNFKYLNKGKEMDIFIKNKDGEYLLNKVWAGKCYFIDFFNPESYSYWEEAHRELYEKLPFSGIWLDMNEIATFEDGQMNFNDYQVPCRDDTKYPHMVAGNGLEKNTICPNAIHHNGMKHVEVHNYYPNQQSMVTNKMLQNMFPDQFPFILTRANAAGIGRYAAHWSGDNYGDYEFYKLSISEVFNLNLFGAPMVGADICGFGKNTSEDLCAKWYQLGSLYPFSRSHAHSDSHRKEPFAMNKTLLETTLKSLQFRYSILKYYYSLFISNKGVGTIFRPLFFEFYNDITTLDNAVIDNFFMIGDSLLVVPNLNEDTTTSTTAYFPKGEWYDLRDNTKVATKSYSQGEFFKVETTLNQMPATFLRSGKTIFTNDINEVTNSYDLNSNFNFLISLDDKKESFGKIPSLIDYFSRSKVEQCMERDCFIGIKTVFHQSTSLLKVKISEANHYENDYSEIGVKKLIIFGLKVSDRLSVISSNLDDFIEAGNKYTLNFINKNCFEIVMSKSLKVRKSELNLEIYLKKK